MDPNPNQSPNSGGGGYGNPYYGGGGAYQQQQAPPPMGYYYGGGGNAGSSRPSHASGGPNSHHPPLPGYTKIYLGQLPLHIAEDNIADVFREYCEIGQLKIVKGNAQGEFTRTCYAFLDIKGSESFTTDVIRKVQQRYPGWKINLRSQYDRPGSKPPRSDFPARNDYQPRQQPTDYPPRSSSYQPRQSSDYQPRQGSDYQPRPSNNDYYRQAPPQHSAPPPASSSRYQSDSPPPSFVPPNFNNRLLADYSGAEKGKKTHKILVRELWIGGIPEGISENQMREIMSQFGAVENLEIFAKFAFVKFRQVSEATNAFEKAARMHELFGKPNGFRVFFSDPEKRTNVVGNHYEYDKQMNCLPILFLGFPPITSSIVDETHMKGICERYGTIVNTYMRKSHSPQTRSYILLTFDSLRNAIRAKMELSKRRDLLGDKRVEVALLMDEEAVMKGHNFDYTIDKFQSSNSFHDKRLPRPGGYPPQAGQYPGMGGMPPYPYSNYPPGYMPPMPMMGMHPNMQNMGMMPYYPMMPMMPMEGMPPGMMKGPFMPDQSEPYQDDMFHIINKVLKSDRQSDDPTQARDKEGHERTPEHERAIYDEPAHEAREPDWSGFLFRNKANKVGIDGYAKTPDFNFEDSLVNITHVMRLSDLSLRNPKQILVVEPTNEISKKTFEQYISYLRKREVAGVAVSYKYLLFVLPKCTKSQDIFRGLTDSELLVVMEDIAVYHELKDKLEKSQQKSSQV